MKRGEYSLKQWCLDNDKQWVLDTWCEDLNGCKPEDVSYRANKKFYFHCGDSYHKPEIIRIANLTSNKCKLTKESFCTGCNSVAEYYNVNHPDGDINDVWSEDNDISPYEVRHGSGRPVLIKCINRIHQDHQSQARFITYDYGCPYCSGRGLYLENSLGYLHPEVISLWSELNDTTPYDYTYGSSKKVFFRCDSGVHDDYERKIEDATRNNFRCPICAYNNKQLPRGENHPGWNPNLNEDEKVRNSGEYDNWRISVFIRDDRTCQCCGSTTKINAHHIKAFAFYPDLRLDISNGITLCSNCHDSTIEGSLHNIYGTHDVSPEILEAFINDTRKRIGLDLPFSLDEFYEGKNILTKEFINSIKEIA